MPFARSRRLPAADRSSGIHRPAKSARQPGQVLPLLQPAPRSVRQRPDDSRCRRVPWTDCGVPAGAPVRRGVRSSAARRFQPRLLAGGASFHPGRHSRSRGGAGSQTRSTGQQNGRHQASRSSARSSGPSPRLAHAQAVSGGRDDGAVFQAGAVLADAHGRARRRRPDRAASRRTMRRRARLAPTPSSGGPKHRVEQEFQAGSCTISGSTCSCPARRWA